MKLKDFEKLSKIKEASLSKEAFMWTVGSTLGRRVAKGLAGTPGRAFNTYMVGSAPGQFTGAVREAKRVANAAPMPTF